MTEQSERYCCTRLCTLTLSVGKNYLRLRTKPERSHVGTRRNCVLSRLVCYIFKLCVYHAVARHERCLESIVLASFDLRFNLPICYLDGINLCMLYSESREVLHFAMFLKITVHRNEANFALCWTLQAMSFRAPKSWWKIEGFRFAVTVMPLHRMGARYRVSACRCT